MKVTKKKAQSKNADTVLVLRTCDANLKSHGGFQWPESGAVEAPDWDLRPECGSGLHGLLWGEGAGSLLNWGADARWLICRVDAAIVVDLRGKVKFPRCEVVHCGDRKSATEYLSANGGAGRAIVGGTSTSGDSGTSTSGDSGTSTSGDSGTSTSGYRGTSTSGYGGTSTSGVRGTSTSGDSGTSTSGDRGTSTSGYGGTSTSGVRGTSTSGVRGTSTSGYGGTSTSGVRGTSTSGDRGTSTSGYGGVIAISHWNGKRYKAKIGRVKDEDGDGELEPNTPYRLNGSGDFVRAEKC